MWDNLPNEKRERPVDKGKISQRYWSKGKKVKVVHDMLPVTRVKNMFMLTDGQLANLPVVIRPNAHSSLYADTRLYKTTSVVHLACKTYGGASGFLSAALAARRHCGAQASGVQSLEASMRGGAQPQVPMGEEEACHGPPAYVLPDHLSAAAEIAMRRRLHFLLQFTTFALQRDTELALRIWVSRFAGRPCSGSALSFPFLPTEMRAEVEVLVHHSSKNSGKRLPAESLWDATLLAEQDKCARARAASFIQQNIPNIRECNLLEQLLQGKICDPRFSDFRYLFLYEWMPRTMVDRGDAVFADGCGRLSVVEAKAKTETSHVTRQSLYYAARLHGGSLRRCPQRQWLPLGDRRS